VWGQRKGLAVLGTGDFTHPGWAAELQQKLEPAEEGLFVLKKEYRGDRATVGEATRFILTAEISSIYKFADKVRKVHNLIFAPRFETVYKIQQKIENLGGNIRSDGRPILGLDSRDLLELCLEAAEDILFVPAHIWTPWFSALGSKSGFDTIAECYRDLTDYIFAVETGLSSDPPMNWMCSFLDRYTLISNSDAHSPEKLGREACLFETDLSYTGVTGAIIGGASAGFRGTVEFFPQEGKYHHDGHRKCGISWDPLTTLHHDNICPVCGKPVTVGVLNRVAQLADRKDIHERPARDPFFSLIPLKEIIAELEGVGSSSKKVEQRYSEYLHRFGSELSILMYTDLEDIQREADSELALSLQRMRERRIHAEAGCDGEYGRIKLWRDRAEISSEVSGGMLFTGIPHSHPCVIEPLGLLDFDLAAYQEQKKERFSFALSLENGHSKNLQYWKLNAKQQQAISYDGGSSLIIAGPGTGKTSTVVEKIVHLVRSGEEPGSIVVVTFANRAAGELMDRLVAAGIDAGKGLFEAGRVGVHTFHGLGLSIIKPYLSLLGRNEDFFIIDDDEKKSLTASEMELFSCDRKNLLGYITRVKNGYEPLPDENNTGYREFRCYQDILKNNNCFDYDDLVYLPVRLFEIRPDIANGICKKIRHIIVDEYQDINSMQYSMLRALSAQATVCAVGDRNQSIYSFRGGSPEFIDCFSADFPGARTFALSRSYRCPEVHLRAAAQVLGEPESSITGLPGGVAITILKAPTAASEAEQIARDIEKRCGGVGFFSFDSRITGTDGSHEISLSDTAVLCRTSLLIPPLEKAFQDHRIPSRTIRTETTFSKEPYRSFMEFIRRFFRCNETTDEAPEDLEEALELFGTREKTGLETPLKEEMKAEISLYWRKGDSARDFLEQARLGSGIDRYDRRMQTVSIMTIHAVKGLEFELVYIPGCEDSIIPCTLSGEAVKDIEEEKRLLYVAMTRAKRNIVLSCAGKRMIFGTTRIQKESPFLESIEKDLVNRQETSFHGDRGTTQRQLSLFDE